MSIETKVKALLFNPKGVYYKYVLNKKLASKNTSNIKTNLVENPKITKQPETNLVKKSLDIDNCPINLISDITKGDFVYIPWILTHGDKMISALEKNTDIKLKPLWLNRNVHDENIRRNINAYARNNPEEFRRFILAHLAVFRNDISAVVLTLDWSTPMRLIAFACKELGIKTILIPHEGVFANENLYYTDIATGVNTPISDYILCWGQQQASIFTQRGYPSERIKIVGSVKLDTYINYKPKLTKHIFCKIYALNPDIKTILFAGQPLDSQFDVKIARESQRKVITELIDYSIENNIQLIIRKPPSGTRLLTNELDKLINNTPLITIDYASSYLSSAEEAIANCDVVVSINSTMLFESLLFGKPAISAKYVNFQPMWTNVNIPAPSQKNELFKELNKALFNTNETMKSFDLSWAKINLSYGSFSGLAIENISNILTKDLSFTIYEPSNSLLNHQLKRRSALNISLNNNLVASNMYLPKILGVNSIYCARTKLEDIKADLFVNWGVTPTATKTQQAKKSRMSGKALFIIEDGFLRSCKIGLSNEPGLSIIIDSKTAYYDARTASLLEDTINSDIEVTSEELERSANNIQLIKSNQLSKYNHAPYVKLNIGKNKNKILLIDQRFGDMSVEAGLADEKTFRNMLLNALENYPDHDILIKRHPDAIVGGKSSYYSNERVGFTKDVSNVYLIDYDVNPYSLFDIVQKVFCVTSGMGFEALIAGKEVHTFGMPFYAGWGLTIDSLRLQRRSKVRSLEEIFFFSYIKFSLYLDHQNMKPGEIEDVIKYLIQNK